MKPAKLTCIIAIALFVALVIPHRLAAQEESPAPNRDAEPLQLSGSGTTNFIPIWTNSTTLGNSGLIELPATLQSSVGMVGLGTQVPTATLTVIGGGSVNGNAPTALQVSGGNGFCPTSNFCGDGGGIGLSGGQGGSLGRFSINGGAGGGINLTAGGGGGVASHLGGPGGSITLQPGAGGSGVTSGAPGNVVIALPSGGTLEVATGGLTLADAWSTRSSLRWKANIHTLEGALETVERLRGVSYDSKVNGKHEIGVIAEEVGQVLPEVVSYEKNGVDAQGVDYARLTALLIEAVKSQEAKIQQLNAQIEQLKSDSAGH
jgi:hypothetical protein